MSKHLTSNRVSWEPILNRIQTVEGHTLPTYMGDLKTALLQHAELINNPKAEEIYQLAVEISRLSTCCDAEVVYWFSRLVALMDA